MAAEHEGDSRKGKSSRRDQNKVRRVRALSLRMSGLSYEDIGKHLDITAGSARNLVNNTLQEAQTREVLEMRELENARLDRAQAAIWKRVLEGDDKAVGTYLRISQHRARINGMNAPVRLDVNMSVKHEMKQALSDLERLVLENGGKRGPMRSELEEIQEAVVLEDEEGWEDDSEAHDEED